MEKNKKENYWGIMKNRKIICGIVFLFLFFLSNETIWAAEKYATIVNPVRSRELWKDKSLKPIEKQYEIINNNEVKATWLLQDDVLDDEELIDKIKGFNEKQEVGVFLEISKNLALKSRVYFDEQRPWHDPGIIFLSAYERYDRKKLIDKIMNNFYKSFGYFPKSVGAWWIDSYSLSYLENKYGIKTALICADQKTTDNYGIWGQWWGYPYFPSKNNILAPGDSKVLVIQWALRDPDKAFFGSGPKVSNYSMQANDYISQELDIKYFEKLANIYFDQRNRLGQITVGLETGIESVGFIDEYQRQIKWIKSEGIISTKMSEIADSYKEAYGKNPTEIQIEEWKLTPQYRENKKLGERINYKNNLVFADYYEKDEGSFLDRIYNEKKLIKKRFFPENFIAYFVAFIVGILVVKKWPERKWLLIVGISWILIFLLEKLRYSVVDGEKMFGFLIDNFRFFGITNKGRIINGDLSNLVAKSMLKLKIKVSSYFGWVVLGVIVNRIYENIIKTRKN